MYGCRAECQQTVLLGAKDKVVDYDRQGSSVNMNCCTMGIPGRPTELAEAVRGNAKVLKNQDTRPGGGSRAYGNEPSVNNCVPVNRRAGYEFKAKQQLRRCLH